MVAKIIEILSQVKEDDGLRNTLQGGSNIIDNVGLDSLQLVDFFLKLEDAFDIEIDFQQFDMTSLRSIDAVCRVIEKAVAGR